MAITSKMFVLSGLEEPSPMGQKLLSSISEPNVTKIYRYVFMNTNFSRLIFSVKGKFGI